MAETRVGGDQLPSAMLADVVKRFDTQVILASDDERFSTNIEFEPLASFRDIRQASGTDPYLRPDALPFRYGEGRIVIAQSVQNQIVALFRIEFSEGQGLAIR
ncbi:hypothetical protein D3C86_1465570 [compost metagenome]